ncbi:MAG: hypothetical protein CR979_03355 [Propionibacterium sp.]|nr:MAG: hypothetical protein CR979_03355 [Propionibacterium sp.]
MITFSVEKFLALANQLAELPWPKSGKDFRKIAVERFNWSPTEYDQIYEASFDSEKEDVIVSELGNEVDEMFFALMLPGPKEKLDASKLKTLFNNYRTAASETWGEPIKSKAGKEPVVAWQQPTGSIVKLIRRADVVLFSFYTPQGAKYFA